MGDVTQLIPVELTKLITTGKMEQEFQVLPEYKVKLGLLWDRENREVYRIVSGLDDLAKFREIIHHTLLRAIISINGLDYTTPERRPILEEVLNVMDSKVKQKMYEYYLKMKEQSELEFERMINQPKKDSSPLNSEKSGGSLEDSDSKTQQTQPSSK